MIKTTQQPDQEEFQEDLKAQQKRSPALAFLQDPTNTSPNGNTRLTQKYETNFAKKMLSLHPNSSELNGPVQSILDKGSKGNQSIFCKKSDQTTYIKMQFQKQQDYLRQKLLLQSLSLIGQNQKVQIQQQQQDNSPQIQQQQSPSQIDENACLKQLENFSLENGIQNSPQPQIIIQQQQQSNQTWKYKNSRFPQLKTFNDSDLNLEIEIGLVSLDQFRKIRQNNNQKILLDQQNNYCSWQDREVQFLMKDLCKSVFELFNCGVFHGDISPNTVYFRQNLIGCYEPVLTDFQGATNNFAIVNQFNPEFWNFENNEIHDFPSKESRLSQELYMVGRTIQRCMLDLPNSKHEENLFKNQTNSGIQRCLDYFRNSKNSNQYSAKTIDCLQILLEKGNIEQLTKKFKKYNKDQVIVDQDKYIDQIFETMCFQHPPLKSIKKVKSGTRQQWLLENNNPNNVSTQESEQENEEENNNIINNKNEEQQVKIVQQMCLKTIKEELQLQMTLEQMKKSQLQKEKKNDEQQQQLVGQKKHSLQLDENTNNQEIILVQKNEHKKQLKKQLKKQQHQQKGKSNINNSKRQNSIFLQQQQQQQLSQQQLQSTNSLSSTSQTNNNKKMTEKNEIDSKFEVDSALDEIENRSKQSQDDWDMIHNSNKKHNNHRYQYKGEQEEGDQGYSSFEEI